VSSHELPDFRQLVLLTSDLEDTLEQARREFDLPKGFRSEADLAKVGMKHEIFGFGHTYVEVCQPTNTESPAARSLAKKGDSGFMVCIQVDDVEAMLERARTEGLEPLVSKDHHGSALTQWHPRDFGTIAEFDEMRPADGWHFAPDVYAARHDGVVGDIVAVDLAVADPETMARRWAVVTGGRLASDERAVEYGRATVRFSTVEGAAGVHAVECRATDRSRAGESVRLAGVDFNLV
jgi:hypothetical protein